MHGVELRPSSRTADSSAGRLERWLTEPFERAGWRGVASRTLRLMLVGSLIWGSIAMAIGGLVGRMSATELLWAVAINEATIVAVFGVGVWFLARDVGAYETWEAAGRPESDAPQMLARLLTSPIRWISWAVVAYVVLCVPTTFAWIFATVEPLSMAILLCVGGILASTVVVWPVALFTGELATRPVIAWICAEFPHLSAPEGHGMSLRTRALLPVPTVTLTTGIITGGMAGLFDEPIEQLVTAIVLSLVFAGVFAVILRFAVTEAALRPVDDLIDGVERISRGDLRSRVPITGADELAVLGRAVNDMTERLAAHEAEMRASRARIVAASDESRRRVERDLHDGAQQYLVLLELKLGLLAKVVANDPKASELAAETRADLARALAELRDLAHGIYPAVLESDGLPGALQFAAERSSIPVAIDADGVGRYARELEAAVYFCCLEALQNASKHAGEGAKVSVRLSQADGRVAFTVADDGRGYDADALGPSEGLQNMADRIGALGGEVTIRSKPGEGTIVRGRVPVVD